MQMLPDELPATQRYVIAIAGAPAAGKSTLAEQLCDALAPRAALLGLDAFHYDNAVLSERGALARKGAPHTFDVGGYQRTVELLRSSPTREIALPVFDRELELARASAHVVTPEQHIVITEGNYLLLDTPPWSALGRSFDLTVWVNVSLDVVTKRIEQRWRSYGFDEQIVQRRLAENDLPNARYTMENSGSATVTVAAV